ncbi:MAG TPA: DUF1648 domain-containing protein [Candidatus Eremiobacteraceae bacterium]|nr:DUF1648 domain-containing protein [Candidatus Eremiobacteraceae bacterium]
MSTTELVGSILEVIAFAAAADAIRVTVMAYPTLPERVPIHFGLTGKPNAWGPRQFVFLVPAIAVVMFIAASVTNPIFGFVLVSKTGAVFQPPIPMPCGVFAMTLVLFDAIQHGMLQSARTGSCLNMRTVLPFVVLLIAFVIGATAFAISRTPR